MRPTTPPPNRPNTPRHQRYIVFTPPLPDMYMCKYMCVYMSDIYMYIYIYIYIYLNIYIYTHTPARFVADMRKLWPPQSEVK